MPASMPCCATRAAASAIRCRSTGPGFVAQVEHMLRACTCNGVQRFAVARLFDVRAAGTGGRGEGARLSGRTGLARAAMSGFQLRGDMLLDEAPSCVRGRLLDHRMPWLRMPELAMLDGAPPDPPIALRWRDRQGEAGRRGRHVGRRPHSRPAHSDVKPCR